MGGIVEDIVGIGYREIDFAVVVEVTGTQRVGVASGRGIDRAREQLAGPRWSTLPETPLKVSDSRLS